MGTAEAALTIIVIGFCLYTFLPRGVRADLGDLAHALADLLRAVLRPLLRLAGRLLFGLFGVPQSTTSAGGASVALPPPAAPPATIAAAPAVSTSPATPPVYVARPDDVSPPATAPAAAASGSSASPAAATSGPTSGAADVDGWSREDIVRALAVIKKIDDTTGQAEYLSMDKIAALAGMNAQKARAIIRRERGLPPLPEDGLTVRDAQGTRVIDREPTSAPVAAGDRQG